jgi:hypothetical protein
MPMFSPDMKSKFQFFISTYLLNTFTAAFLEKEPFSRELISWQLRNPIAPLTTSTFEPVFPFLTSRFGLDIPTDLNLKVKRIYDIQAIPDGKNVHDNDITSKGIL